MFCRTDGRANTLPERKHFMPVKASIKPWLLFSSDRLCFPCVCVHLFVSTICRLLQTLPLNVSSSNVYIPSACQGHRLTYGSLRVQGVDNHLIPFPRMLHSVHKCRPVFQSLLIYISFLERTANRKVSGPLSDRCSKLKRVVSCQQTDSGVPLACTSPRHTH